jgi:hypothetical protein
MALQGIVDEVNKNPTFGAKRHKLEGFDVITLKSLKI